MVMPSPQVQEENAQLKAQMEQMQQQLANAAKVIHEQQNLLNKSVQLPEGESQMGLAPMFGDV